MIICGLKVYASTVAPTCQAYQVECHLIPPDNTGYLCSATIPAFSGIECAELHPPYCNQPLTVEGTSPGISAIANGRLANVTVSVNLVHLAS